MCHDFGKRKKNIEDTDKIKPSFLEKSEEKKILIFLSPVEFLDNYSSK